MAEFTSAQRRLNNSGPWLVVLVALMPVAAWLHATGDVRVYLDYDVPPGQGFYVAAKLAGLYAMVLLWLQVILALLSRPPLRLRPPRWSLNYHRNLGILTLSALLLHAGLFTAAVSLRTSTFAYAVLVPDFSAGYYTTATALGVLAVYGAGIVILAGVLRRRGVDRARWLHRLSVPCLLLALTHCLLIGSEARSTAMVVVYAAMTAVLVAVLAVSCWMWFRRHRARTAAPG